MTAGAEGHPLCERGRRGVLKRVSGQRVRKPARIVPRSA